MSGEPIGVVDRLSIRERPPGLPIMHQHWGSLLFTHWPVPADLLRPLIPEPLVVDTHDGLAWAGITPFTMWGVRAALAPPLPYLSESHELNVRTYVHLDGVPGVWFLSLDAGNAAAVLGARVAFHLPYFRARMSLGRRGRTVYFSSRRVGRWAAPAEFEAVWTLGARLGEAPRVRWTFSWSNGTASTPPARAGSTALGSSTGPGRCTVRACRRTDRR
jgi:uncharacterized protein YqjF (DUF2071 family)